MSVRMVMRVIPVCSVTQLSNVIQSPTLHRSVVEKSAGGIAARRNRNGCPSRAEINWRRRGRVEIVGIIRPQVTITQPSVVVVSPTLQIAVVNDCTRFLVPEVKFIVSKSKDRRG